MSYRLVSESGVGASADLAIAWTTNVTAYGDGYKIRVPAASTTALVAGPYRLLARVTGTDAAGDAVTKSWQVGRVLAHANAASEAGAKSFARTMRDALRTAMTTGAADAGLLTVQVNGRSTTYAHADAEILLARYEYLVALEENPGGSISHEAVFTHA